MILLTGNDLKTGDVIWWAGETEWSRHLSDAVDAAEEADAALAREEAAQRVNASYSVEAEMTEHGPMPLHIKDRIRASGPTVRRDLAIDTGIPIEKG
ncbi:DUF2849 domain-containing protein [Novosphingopyxis sp.]|uniref:DUF2849 domain-containing protein n=1 Tax=Novosphingopyxis sp. TaxID=2709690 RepID=UPI003B5B057D